MQMFECLSDLRIHFDNHYPFVMMRTVSLRYAVFKIQFSRKNFILQLVDGTPLCDTPDELLPKI